MTSKSKNVYIDKLDDIADECSNTYHRTIKMKPFDVKFGNHVEYNVHSNDKDPKFQVGEHVRILKNKYIFAKEYTPQPKWSQKDFMIKKVKNIVPWAYVIIDLNSEKISEIFHQKDLPKINQGEFTKSLEKLIKKKSDKTICLMEMIG